MRVYQIKILKVQQQK